MFLTFRDDLGDSNGDFKKPNAYNKGQATVCNNLLEQKLRQVILVFF